MTAAFQDLTSIARRRHGRQHLPGRRAVGCRQVDAGQRPARARPGHRAVGIAHDAAAAARRAEWPRVPLRLGRGVHEAARGSEFLESAEVHGNYYATSRVWIEDRIRSGTDVLLEIDWQGARQVKPSFARPSASSSCRHRSMRWKRACTSVGRTRRRSLHGGCCRRQRDRACAGVRLRDHQRGLRYCAGTAQRDRDRDPSATRPRPRGTISCSRNSESHNHAEEACAQLESGQRLFPPRIRWLASPLKIA